VHAEAVGTPGCHGNTRSRTLRDFGRHTREHLDDRPRTVCQPGPEGRVVWNTTFKAFADDWGFEPRLCRAYRPQTKEWARSRAA
jgi:transposase